MLPCETTEAGTPGAQPTLRTTATGQAAAGQAAAPPAPLLDQVQFTPTSLVRDPPLATARLKAYSHGERLPTCPWCVIQRLRRPPARVQGSSASFGGSSIPPEASTQLPGRLLQAGMEGLTHAGPLLNWHAPVAAGHPQPWRSGLGRRRLQRRPCRASRPPGLTGELKHVCRCQALIVLAAPDTSAPLPAPCTPQAGSSCPLQQRSAEGYQLPQPPAASGSGAEQHSLTDGLAQAASAARQPVHARSAAGERPLASADLASLLARLRLVEEGTQQAQVLARSALGDAHAVRQQLAQAEARAEQAAACAERAAAAAQAENQALRAQLLAMQAQLQKLRAQPAPVQEGQPPGQGAAPGQGGSLEPAEGSSDAAAAAGSGSQALRSSKLKTRALEDVLDFFGCGRTPLEVEAAERAVSTPAFCLRPTQVAGAVRRSCGDCPLPSLPPAGGQLPPGHLHSARCSAAPGAAAVRPRHSPGIPARHAGGSWRVGGRAACHHCRQAGRRGAQGDCAHGAAARQR